jgi:hypothetical protein
VYVKWAQGQTIGVGSDARDDVLDWRSHGASRPSQRGGVCGGMTIVTSKMRLVPTERLACLVTGRISSPGYNFTFSHLNSRHFLHLTITLTLRRTSSFALMARSIQGNEQNSLPSMVFPTVPTQPHTAMVTVANLSNTRCIALLEGQRLFTFDARCSRLMSACQGFCSAVNIPAPRYRDWSHESRGFTSQVMFGHVDTAFGKHKGPTSLQESRGEAARRALRWIERLGMLPRYGLHHGFAGDSSSSHHADHLSVVAAAAGHQFQFPTNTNHSLQSANGSHQSMSSTTTTTTFGLPTLPQSIHSGFSMGLEHATHQVFQPASGPDRASAPSTSLGQAQKPLKVSRRPRKKSTTGGPTSSAANTVPLKRRRLPEKPVAVSTEVAAPVLTKQGLLSRMSLHKEHLGRVAGEIALQEQARLSQAAC